MPRNSDDGETDAAQSLDPLSGPHTVFIEEMAANRITELAETDRVEPHTLGGSVFSSEGDGSSLSFLVTEVQTARAQEQMPNSVGIIDLGSDSRSDDEPKSEKLERLPRLKVTAIDPLEGHIVRNVDNQEMITAVESFRKAVEFNPLRTEDSQTTRESPVEQTDQSNRESRSSNESEVDRGEFNESIPLNLNEEIRAISTMFDGISKSDFSVLDNENIGVELSIVPTSDVVDKFDILIEYDDSFPEYPPRVWVQSPDISSDDEAVVEVDQYGDARIQYIDPDIWAQHQNTEIALEYLAGWATAYCKHHESKAIE